MNIVLPTLVPHPNNNGIFWWVSFPSHNELRQMRKSICLSTIIIINGLNRFSPATHLKKIYVLWFGLRWSSIRKAYNAYENMITLVPHGFFPLVYYPQPLNSVDEKNSNSIMIISGTCLVINLLRRVARERSSTLKLFKVFNKNAVGYHGCTLRFNNNWKVS